MHEAHEVRAMDLHRRDVDRQGERVRPGHGLAASLAQHPLADLQDDVAFLGDGNEHRRRDVAPLRVLPAQQHLEAGDLAAADLGLRLVDEVHLAPCHGMAQVVLQEPALAYLQAHLGLEEAVGAATLRLGAVERRVRVAQQRGGFVGVIGVEGNANAGRDLGAAARVGLARAQRLQDALRQASGRRGVLAGHQDGELVAAEPRHHLGVVELGRDDAGDGLQHRVSGGVAEQVVDLLEAVEVEAEHRELAVARVSRPDLKVEPLAEANPVGESREGVMVGQEMDLALGLAAGSQVAHGDGVVRSAGMLHGLHDDLDRHHLAICAAELGLDGPLGLAGQGKPGRVAGQERRQRCAHEGCRRLADQASKGKVRVDDNIAGADHQSLDGRIGEAAQAVALKLGMLAVTDVERQGGACEQQDGKAR